jgi:hypothetical protein
VDSSSKDGLWADYLQGLELISHGSSQEGHELLGRTLRDVGWCRHAVFHYGMAWKHSWYHVGDYAQMTELAGFPELGVLALLYYRTGRQFVAEKEKPETPAHENGYGSAWLRQKPPPEGDCGCGDPECWKTLCFLSPADMHPIVEALHYYSQNCKSRMADMPSSGSVLASLGKSKPFLISTEKVPELLQFWKTDESNDPCTLEPVLQLLLVKLLYVTLPALAAEAVARLEFEHPRTLANDYKSHWAYFVLIRAVVLGERIKPHRRLLLGDAYHVPVWDLMWQKDRRLDRPVGADTITSNIPIQPVQWVEIMRYGVHGGIIPQVQWTLPSSRAHKPLYVVGDSHVLSIAWTTVLVPTSDATWQPRLIVPCVVTGVKAWHVRPDTNFFTHAQLHSVMNRLPPGTATILLSAGEIDCREGIGGPLLEGYNLDFHIHVRRTVQEYVNAVSALSEQYSLQILVMPVAPHAHRSDKNGKSAGRQFRRHLIQAWNGELRMALPRERVFLLDYEQRLRHAESTSSVGYVLNPIYNADFTHMNSAFLPQLESAIQQSGCDPSLL